MMASAREATKGLHIVSACLAGSRAGPPKYGHSLHAANASPENSTLRSSAQLPDSE